MLRKYRERKPLSWQLGALHHAIHNLIRGQGKHRDHLTDMDPELVHEFQVLARDVNDIHTHYESFLKRRHKKSSRI